MKQKLGFCTLAILFSTHIVWAQFIAKDEPFTVGSVSNAGKVSGYKDQAGPYYIWLPDSANVLINVGGVAPGNGVGGQARFSAAGNLMCGTSRGVNGPEMSKYDRATNEWTTVGSLGFSVDNNVSGGFAISGDGNTIAGLAWADTTSGAFYAHAVAYNPTEGLMDLGSLFADSGKSTRANAVSYNGNVIVGWQDFNGPWKSAVWRKNPAGGYYPNQYILLDTAGNPNDEYNQMGECSAVSADGNWVGGYGDYANNYQPWIWSRDSGVINLGTLPNTGTGYVSAMTADASTVVGWFDGQLFGDPQTPFIWTRTGGLRELNEYINNVLGDSTYTQRVYTAESISPDGHYIAGFGIDNSTFTTFAYRVSLVSTPTGINAAAATPLLNVYPNPATNLITLQNAGKAVLTITGADGRVVHRQSVSDRQTLDVSGYAPGVYLLTVQANGITHTQRLVKL